MTSSQEFCQLLIFSLMTNFVYLMFSAKEFHLLNEKFLEVNFFATKTPFFIF